MWIITIEKHLTLKGKLLQEIKGKNSQRDGDIWPMEDMIISSSTANDLMNLKQKNMRGLIGLNKKLRKKKPKRKRKSKMVKKKKRKLKKGNHLSKINRQNNLQRKMQMNEKDF